MEINMTKARAERAFKLLGELRKKYKVMREYKPLSKSIKDDLIKATNGDIPVCLLNKALSMHTNSMSYLRKCLKYNKRYNLKNAPIEMISEEEKTYAKSKCKEKVKLDKKYNYTFKNSNLDSSKTKTTLSPKLPKQKTAYIVKKRTLRLN